MESVTGFRRIRNAVGKDDVCRFASRYIDDERARQGSETHSAGSSHYDLSSAVSVQMNNRSTLYPTMVP